MQTLTLPTGLMVDLAHFYRLMPPDETLEVNKSLGVKGIMRIESVVDAIDAATAEYVQAAKDFGTKQQDVVDSYKDQLSGDDEAKKKEATDAINAKFEELAKEAGLEEKRKAEVVVELGDDKFELARDVFSAVSCKKIFKRGNQDTSFFTNKEDLKDISKAFKIEE